MVVFLLQIVQGVHPHDVGGDHSAGVEEQRLVRFELQALADDIHELADAEFARYQVLGFVDVWAIHFGKGCALANHGHAVWVLLQDAFSF